MDKKRVLVCGASGFLGFNVFQRLLDRPDVEVCGTYLTNRYNRITPGSKYLLRADLTQQETVQGLINDLEPDTIIQMAANSSGAKDVVTNPALHITDNVAINNWVFRIAHDLHVPQVIFPSCTVMYQNSEQPLKETEFDRTQESSKKYFGGATMKVFCEDLGRFFSQLGRTCYTMIRHSNVYGSHDRFDPERSHVCGANINRVLQAPNASTIKVWGQGAGLKDFLYVDDLVDFIELVLNQQDYPFEIFNVGSGQTFTTGDWIRNIIRASGKDLQLEFDSSKPSIGNRITIDCNKAKDYFGWQAKISPEIGLQRTIAWYKENILGKE